MLRSVLCTEWDSSIFSGKWIRQLSCRTSADARMRRCGKGNAWLISFLFQSWMKCLTQLLAHCLQERGINLTRCCSFPLLLCGQLCCTEDAGGGGEGGKRKRRKSPSKLHKKGPVWECNVKWGTQEQAMSGKVEAGKTEPTHSLVWFIHWGAQQTPFPRGSIHDRELWTLMFSIKRMREVHGEGSVANKPMIQGHICQLHYALCRTSLWSTDTHATTFGEAITVTAWCAANTGNIPGCLWSWACHHYFRWPSFPKVEQVPTLGNADGEHGHDMGGIWGWEMLTEMSPLYILFITWFLQKERGCGISLLQDPM